ncbi:MAG TPA: LysM peptidoglycan-binding domain-containing protein [Candidatus Hypogeohydataceae bacterium YC41]
MSKKSFIRRIEVQVGIILGVTMFSIIGVFLGIRKGEKGHRETALLAKVDADTADILNLKELEQAQAASPRQVEKVQPKKGKVARLSKTSLAQESSAQGASAPPEVVEAPPTPPAKEVKTPQEGTQHLAELVQSKKGTASQVAESPSAKETAPLRPSVPAEFKQTKSLGTTAPVETKQTKSLSTGVPSGATETAVPSSTGAPAGVTEAPPTPPAEIPALSEETQVVRKVLPSLEQKSPLPTTHTVKANDTLSSLAKKYYGDDTKWTLIYEANQLSNQHLLTVGQKLTIPSPEEAQVEKQKIVKVSTAKIHKGAPGRAHRVQEGETLHTLARMYYGDESKWRRIYNANQDIFSQREELEPGDVLIIP